jgi:hypothetical protein
MEADLTVDRPSDEQRAGRSDEQRDGQSDQQRAEQRDEQSDQQRAEQRDEQSDEVSDEVSDELDVHEPGISDSERGRRLAIAATRREFARMLARDEAAARSAERARAARRRHDNASVVFSLRLDPAELEALERRAEANGLKPSGLARNLIRVGLAQHAGDDDGGFRRAMDRLHDAADQLRGAVCELQSFVP